MARPKQFVPTEAVDAALGVFWECGFGATSIDDLTSATGLSRSSLYAEFGSKRDLFSVVVDRVLERWSARLAELPAEGLEGVVALFENLPAGFDPPGDLIVNAVAELAPDDADFVADVERFRTMIQEALLAALEAAEAAGAIDPGRSVSRSILLSTQLLGLLVELRTKPIPADFNASLGAVVAEIDSWRILSFEERLKRRR